MGARCSALQRGRTPESAESLVFLVLRDVVSWLQRGRTPESAESCGLSPARLMASLLQRGRTPESAESSMRFRRAIFPASLQRGRTPESAESSLCATCSRSFLHRFNGAALRRVRRVARRWLRSSHRKSFNGAALRRVRRDRPLRRAAEAFAEASTGPHSGECGETSNKNAEPLAPPGFNGAALRRVRRDANDENQKTK